MSEPTEGDRLREEKRRQERREQEQGREEWEREQLERDDPHAHDGCSECIADGIGSARPL